MWSKNKHIYFIAEVGQNHNGDMTIAKKMIAIAAMPIFDYFSGKQLPSINAVKFVKRDLSEEFTDRLAHQVYSSPNSFGNTYLEHRVALELSIEQHRELEQYAHSKNLDFIETLCSPRCLELLDKVDVDSVKIASRDVTNIPLLKVLGKLNIPIIISSGMSSLGELKTAVEILLEKPKQLAILHCLSQYPASYENLNLLSIPFLKKQFPGIDIGYSDHSVGIAMPLAAVALDATIIEKHITLSRTMKGSDHKGALEPDGLWRVVRNIRNLEEALGSEDKKINPVVQKTKNKQARSLVLQISVKKGQIFQEGDFGMRSPGIGMSWDDHKLIIGKRAKRNIPANSLLYKTDVE